MQTDRTWFIIFIVAIVTVGIIATLAIMSIVMEREPRPSSNYVPNNLSDPEINPLQTVETEILQVFDGNLKAVNWQQNMTTNDTLKITFGGQPINNEDQYTVHQFFCSVNEEQYSACISPFTIVNMTKGNHVFEVSAEDNFGNMDSTPAVFMWSVR